MKLEHARGQMASMTTKKGYTGQYSIEHGHQSEEAPNKNQFLYRHLKSVSKGF